MNRRASRILQSIIVFIRVFPSSVQLLQIQLFDCIGGAIPRCVRDHRRATYEAVVFAREVLQILGPSALLLLDVFVVDRRVHRHG